MNQETIFDPIEAGDSEEYIKEMVDRAEGKKPEAPAEPAEEEKLFAGKYKSIEDLEKGYLELQKAYSGRSKDDPPAEPEGKTEESMELPPKNEGEEAVPDGIDFEKYTKSFVENGRLTEEDYAELAEKHKLPKAVVDVYVAGLQAEMSNRASAAVKAVGSQEEFEAVRQWASNSLSDAEYEATQNAIRNARSAEELGVIYGNLAYRYRQANPGEPSLVAGNAPVAPAVAGYRSRAEMTKAINDPRYQEDEGYRAEVERKIARSNFI